MGQWPSGAPEGSTGHRLAVLSNGESRGNRGGRWARLPLAGLGGPSLLTHNLDELPAALDAILAAHADALAVNGGDGTLQTLLAACVRRGVLAELPPIAVLPGGTTNMCAHDLSGLGNLRRAIRAYAELRDHPRATWPVVRRPVMRIETGDGPTAGLLIGLGAVVHGVEYWQEALRRHPRGGDLGVAWAIARSLWQLARRRPPFDRPTLVGLAFDGAPSTPAAVSALVLTTLDRLPLRMRPYWGDHRGPLVATWMDARPVRPLRHMPPLLWGHVRGLPTDDGYHSLRASRAVLDVNETWLLDGELQDAPGPLVVSVGGPLAFLDLRRVP